MGWFRRKKDHAEPVKVGEVLFQETTLSCPNGHSVTIDTADFIACTWMPFPGGEPATGDEWRARCDGLSAAIKAYGKALQKP